MSAELLLTSVLLGAGLAMDAFSVSVANGLADSDMAKSRMFSIACTFAGFQFAMPVIGWFCVTKAAEKFEWFSPLIPWIALVLLLIIGGGLLKDGIEELRSSRSADGETGADLNGADAVPDGETGAASDGNRAGRADTGSGLSFTALMMQGIATSIDALSVGFTTSSYNWSQALLSSLIIGIVTFVICMAGLRIGRRLGEFLAGRASVLGGIILICIGLEIWLKGVFF